MGNAIANMIVKLGMDTSKFEEGSNSADNIMKKFGDTITKSFLKSQIAMKALSLGFDLVKKGVSAAVQGFTKLVDGAKTAYASYEQLSGGVETLFGAGGKSLEKYAESIGATAEEAAGKYDMLMEAQSRVFDNAHKAWYTAGLSANDYMNTVTGFAASLKQSTSNSIEAADVADMAIQDMADNANKMGSSMDSIQTAYQGFAKGQYNMLDNLKLGYGGTKEEMERLLADAEKLTGTKYDINSLKDVYNAIHAIQGELGITGTTSNEAFSTLEGSSKALGAAWENVKVSIAGGGEDVESSFEQMGIALQAAALNLVPRLGQIFGGIGEAMFRVIPTIGDKLIQIIPSIVPKFVAGGIKLAIGLVTGIGQGLKVIWKLIEEIWKQLGEVLKGLGLKELGANIMKSILTGIKIGWNDILAWFYEAIGNLVSWLENWLTDKLGKIADLPVIKDLFKDLRSVQVDLGGSDLKGKAEDRKSQSSKLRSEQTQLLGEIKTDMLTFEEDLFDKCNDILDGEDGISGQVKQAGKDIVDAVTPEDGGDSSYTAYDAIQDMLAQWKPGEWNKDLAVAIQTELDKIIPDIGDQIGNWTIIDDPSALQNLKPFLDKHAGDDTYRNFDSTGLENRIGGVESGVGGVETAVENQKLDPQITVETDTTGIEAEVGKVETAINAKDFSPTIENDVDTTGIEKAIQSVTVTSTVTVNYVPPEFNTEGIETAIKSVTITNKVETTIPKIEVPEAEVTVTTDTSVLDASAAALSAAGSNLTTSADNLDTSASNLQSAISNPYLNPYMSDSEDKGVVTNYSGHNTANSQAQAILAGIWDKTNKTGGQTKEAAAAFPTIPEETITSWANLADAVNRVSGVVGGEDGTGGLSAALTPVKDLLNKTYAESKRLGDYWAGDFVTSIDTMLQHVCLTSTDEEGNVDASGGNTLVTAMGVVFDLFGDILNTSTQLAEHWLGSFIPASVAMRTEAGNADGTLQSLAGTASGTAAQFLTLSNSIYDTIDAYLALARVKNGGGKGGGNGRSVVELRAAGGPVRAGDSYIVGERGPEFFTPRRSGYIIPNEELGSGNRPEITVNVGNVYGESYLKDKVVEIMTGAIRKEMRLAA